MFDGHRDMSFTWRDIFSLAGWLSQIARSGELSLFFVHKVLFLSLSVGRRHRQEPGLTGLWRILLVLQDDFHTPGPLSDNDLVQQSEGSHGSSRPRTLSGERTEGATKMFKPNLHWHFFTTHLYRSFDLVVECDIYPQDTKYLSQEDKEKKSKEFLNVTLLS